MRWGLFKYAERNIFLVHVFQLYFFRFDCANMHECLDRSIFITKVLEHYNNCVLLKSLPTPVIGF